jgi:tetratricopeptide (TPR) repeat protein
MMPDSMTDAPMTDTAESTSRPLPLAPKQPLPASFWVGVIILPILVFASYWPSMRGEFLWDDDYYVTNNSALVSQDGIERIWVGVKNPRTYPVPQYYPMTHTSFWVQTRWHDFNKPLSPTPFHVVNVLLHVFSAWMLWAVLRRLRVPGAFFAAAIWAVHPVQVESVAWITERKNVLSGFFFFASMLVYMRFAELDEAPPKEQRGALALPDERWKLYALALILFICSILSKSVTGSMPAIVLLLIWWKRGRIKSSDVLPLIPFFACALAMGITTSYFERNIVGAQGDEWSYTPIQRLFIASGAVWFYASKVIFPWKLAFFYSKWNLQSPLLIGALLGAIAIVAALFGMHRRIGRGPVVAVLLFAGTLFPALGFINVFPMRYSYVADHFQYLACAALIAGAVWLLHRFLKQPIVFVAICSAILGIFTALTFKQNFVYRSGYSLWKDTISKTPDAWIAHNNLGVLLREANMLDEAENEFRTVLDYRPDQVEAIMNIGLVHEKRGDIDGAISVMHDAITAADKDPIHAPSYAKLYWNLGRLMSKKGDLQASQLAFRASVELDRRYVPGIIGMGEVLFKRGDLVNAQKWLERALEIDPFNYQAHADYGNVLAAQGDAANAMKEWQKVLDHDPNDAMTLNSVGALFMKMEQFDAAIFMLKRALQQKPDFEEAQKNLVAAIRYKEQAATRPSTTQSAMPSPTQPATTHP